MCTVRENGTEHCCALSPVDVIVRWGEGVELPGTGHVVVELPGTGGVVVNVVVEDGHGEDQLETHQQDEEPRLKLL